MMTDLPRPWQIQLKPDFKHFYADPHVYIIPHRPDTNEYLGHHEFWDRSSIRWTTNFDEPFRFKTHSDEEE